MAVADALSQIGEALNGQAIASQTPPNGVDAALADIAGAGSFAAPGDARERGFAPAAPRMRDEPFTDPMSGQVLGTQTGPEMPGSPALTDAARFGITAGARGLGAAANFLSDPLAGPRSMISPDLDRALTREVGTPPGTTLGDAFFKGTSIPESDPKSIPGRIGLAGLTSAVAGGPFGAGAAALTGLGGLLGQGTMEATGSERLATGAGMLPLLGARPMQAGGRFIADRFAPYETQAARQLAKSFGYDTAGGGPDFNSIREAFVAPEAQGKPLAIADVAGPSVQGRGESIANRPGPGAQIARQFLENRDKGAGPRSIGDLNDAMGTDASAFKTAEALANQRQLNSTPLYEKALNTGKTIHSDRLQQFLDDPVLQKGLAQGIEVQRLEALAEGKPFKPDDYTIAYDDSGTPRFAATPNMRTLDAAKRGLDNILDQYRDATTGRLVLDQRGRAIDQVRKSYVAELDSLNGDYAAARQAYSGPSQSRDAVKQGRSMFDMEPEQLADTIQRLAPGDKDFFKIGARQAMAKQIARTPTGSNEAARITGNQYIQDQLRPLFETDAEYNSFIGRANLESAMFRTKTEMLGNARTFRRFAHAEADGGGSALDNAIAGIGLVSGNPYAAIPALLKAGVGRLGRMVAPSPEVDANIARMLFNGDPQTNAAALQAIEAARRPRGLLTPPLAPMGLLSGERGR